MYLSDLGIHFITPYYFHIGYVRACIGDHGYAWELKRGSQHVSCTFSFPILLRHFCQTLDHLQASMYVRTYMPVRVGVRVSRAYVCPRLDMCVQASRVISNVSKSTHHRVLHQCNHLRITDYQNKSSSRNPIGGSNYRVSESSHYPSCSAYDPMHRNIRLPLHSCPVETSPFISPPLPSPRL